MSQRYMCEVALKDASVRRSFSRLRDFEGFRSTIEFEHRNMGKKEQMQES